MLIESAVHVGQPPTAFILRKPNPRKAKWSEWDYALVEALTLYEQEICKRCGNFTYVCHSDHPNIRFSVVEDECEGEKAIDNHRELHKNDAKQFGVQLRARAYSIDGSDLTKYRRGYYLERSAEYRTWLESHQTLIPDR